MKKISVSTSAGAAQDGHGRRDYGRVASHYVDHRYGRRCHETDRGAHDRRYGQFDHPDADCYSNLVFYLEAQDYEFRLSDQDDIRQAHVALIGAFLVRISNL